MRLSVSQVRIRPLGLVFQMDFNEMSFGDGEFDKAYAIEATCHAVNARKAFGEIYRVLKPGGLFGCYEWCMTDMFDPNNEKHQKLKQDLLVMFKVAISKSGLSMLMLIFINHSCHYMFIEVMRYLNDKWMPIKCICLQTKLNGLF